MTNLLTESRGADGIQPVRDLKYRKRLLMLRQERMIHDHRFRRLPSALCHQDTKLLYKFSDPVPARNNMQFIAARHKEYPALRIVFLDLFQRFKSKAFLSLGAAQLRLIHCQTPVAGTHALQHLKTQFIRQSLLLMSGLFQLSLHIPERGRHKQSQLCIRRVHGSFQKRQVRRCGRIEGTSQRHDARAGLLLHSFRLNDSFRDHQICLIP